MTKQALIVGGGIGGLSAGLACMRAGWEARLYEQAGQLSEVGAGIQLGPNATRLLRDWELGDALARVATLPEKVQVRNALDGEPLASMRLGTEFSTRYGAPYVTVHRADLQLVLLTAARRAGIDLKMASAAIGVRADLEAVRLSLPGMEVEGDALIGADGLWSSLRSQAWGDGPPAFTGHLAYRALTHQKDLPESMRSNDVTVWLGPRLHLVTYPLRAGAQLNVVALVEGQVREGPAGRDWNQSGAVADLQAAMGPLCAPLRDLVAAMPAWRLWALHDRPPLAGPEVMARGRIALVGDAAHPMLPYFAQGAGMAIEDAAELGSVLAMALDNTIDVPLALRRYGINRWQRNARVQALSRRNGRIFHASGPVRWGRDLSLRLLGEKLLDQPWLYQR
jgi:salicylate hydroxylase